MFLIKEIEFRICIKDLINAGKNKQKRDNTIIKYSYFLYYFFNSFILLGFEYLSLNFTVMKALDGFGKIRFSNSELCKEYYLKRPDMNKSYL